MNLEIRNCSSLTQVLRGKRPPETNRGGALRGERFAFQVAYRCDRPWCDLTVRILSPLAGLFRVRQVQEVPVDFIPETDANVIGKRCGFYPDLLTELLPGNTVVSAENIWKSLWISIDIPLDLAAGIYPTAVEIGAPGENALFRGKPFQLEILPFELPPQTMRVTHWFHADCLATWYQTKVFSEKHWRIMERFLTNAVEHGMNTLLTPLFTPPLDTAVGGERPTVQLVGVSRDAAGNYRFDFSRLKRWIEMGRRCGITAFEMSHLFTQWGARATPKITAVTPDGRTTRIFGWDVPAEDPRYASFLAALLPELRRFLEAEKLEKDVYFHVSDEPHEEDLARYAYGASLLNRFLPGFKRLDALSSVAFFRHGLLPIPIPGLQKFDDFSTEELPERWVYYCGQPQTVFPNRFIHMPSARNRVMGMLFHRYRVDGFLHWGFNFYYSRFSKFPIDPFRDVCAGMAFPAGDAFLVYPGTAGMPLDSLRHENFHDALQDRRLLQLLSSRIGAAETDQLLDRSMPGGRLTWSTYPGREKQLLSLRHKIETRLKATGMKGEKTLP